MARMTEEELLAKSAKNRKAWVDAVLKAGEKKPEAIKEIILKSQVAHVSKSGKVGKFKPIIPTEAQEQVAVIRWCDAHPIAREIYATQGGLRTSIGAARKAKAQGMRSGVPDLILDVPAGGYHGLRIELKRRKGGKLSAEQHAFGLMMTDRGYRWEMCRGADEAIEVIQDYLTKE